MKSISHTHKFILRLPNDCYVCQPLYVIHIDVYRFGSYLFDAHLQIQKCHEMKSISESTKHKIASLHTLTLISCHRLPVMYISVRLYKITTGFNPDIKFWANRPQIYCWFQYGWKLKQYMHIQSCKIIMGRTSSLNISNSCI